jgi:trehalose-phosphatase
VPPKYLFNEWPRLARELGEHKTACILLDIDGTLSPFAKKPHLASIPPETKRTLLALSTDTKFRVGVVSGRSLADVRQMVDIQGIFYAGNHGLEVEGPGVLFVLPDVEKITGEVKKCASALAQNLVSFKGAIVEDKGLTASVHYRLVGERDVKPMLRAIDKEARKYRNLTLRHGKKVVEIRPDIIWGKGNAAELMLAKIGGDCLPIYIGDDETDEDAFNSSMITWTVRVMEKNIPTKAKYYLRNVDEVRSFLQRLVEWSALTFIEQSNAFLYLNDFSGV